MANNCLVTRLRSVVNNPSLKKLGVLTIHAVATTSITDQDVQRRMQISVNSPVTVKVSSPHYFTLNSPVGDQYTEYVIESGSVAIYFENGTYDIEFLNKYGITEIDTYTYSGTYPRIFSIDLDELPSCLSLTKANIPYWGINGNIDSLSTCPALTFLRMTLPNASGDTSFIARSESLRTLETLHIEQCYHISSKISDFAKNTELKKLVVTSVYNRFGGKLSELGQLTKLTSLILLADYAITGDLTTLCDAMIANGRTSGVMEVFGGILYNGNVIGMATPKTVTFSSGSYVIS